MSETSDRLNTSTAKAEARRYNERREEIERAEKHLNNLTDNPAAHAVIRQGIQMKIDHFLRLAEMLNDLNAKDRKQFPPPKKKLTNNN